MCVLMDSRAQSTQRHPAQPSSQNKPSPATCYAMMTSHRHPDDAQLCSQLASLQFPHRDAWRYHKDALAAVTHLEEGHVNLLVPSSYSRLVKELRLMGGVARPKHTRRKSAAPDLPYRTGGGYRPHGRSGSRRSRGVQQELKENVRRTVYISDVDRLVTEEGLATFFADCGCVIDCRVCGDPNSCKRFAFIEFVDEVGAGKALDKNGAVMGSCSIRVLPSKTAIVPVNRDFMPKNMQEMELCSRTVYVANIDKKVDKHDVRRFFERLCGKVTRLRLLGDYAHSTRIAFVEFTVAESALDALNCSGAVLGTLPIRVSPSKAPVRMCSASDCED